MENKNNQQFKFYLVEPNHNKEEFVFDRLEVLADYMESGGELERNLKKCEYCEYRAYCREEK